MTEEPERFSVFDEEACVRAAVCRRFGKDPGIVWFCGLASSMSNKKIEAIDAWAGACGRACLRFDYGGHGESSGDFSDGDVSAWLRQSLAVVREHAGPHPIFAGSSMGAWIALLAARALQKEESLHFPSSFLLLAPAVDFTEKLIWEKLAPAEQRAFEETGTFALSSEGYPDTPLMISLRLIKDGRKNLLFDQKMRYGVPFHVMHGSEDGDVPLAHVEALLERLPHEEVTFTLIDGGDHSLSRESDLEVIFRALSGLFNER